MDFSRFDQRGYPVTSVTAGYNEWAETYDAIVQDAMDIRLLDRLTSITWADIDAAVDLACGTGRIGVWLHERGVATIDGLDVASSMLDRASARHVYTRLAEGDLRSTPFDTAAYGLATASLVDEHLVSVRPMYAEAARLLRGGGSFVVVGYHPQFLMSVGMPTHFHRADGAAVAIETHAHLLSDHVKAAHEHRFTLVEMDEGLIDEEYVRAKPKWKRYLSMPVSFAFVWSRGAM